jgi:hypothetical protein
VGPRKAEGTPSKREWGQGGTYTKNSILVTAVPQLAELAEWSNKEIFRWCFQACTGKTDGGDRRTHFEELTTESLRLPGEDTQTSEQYDNIDIYRRRSIDVLGRRTTGDMQRGRGKEVAEGSRYPSTLGIRPCRLGVLLQSLSTSRSVLRCSLTVRAGRLLSVDRLAKACFASV